jgi:hypothetical protein
MLINYPIQANLLYIMPVLVFLIKVVHMLFLIYCLLTVVNFAEIVSSNFASIQKERADNTWLQARCKEQKFLENLGHHKHLCETGLRQVERQTQTNAYFVAEWLVRLLEPAASQGFVRDRRKTGRKTDTDQRVLRRRVVVRLLEWFQTWDKRPWYNRRMPLYSATPMRPSTTYETNAYDLFIWPIDKTHDKNFEKGDPAISRRNSADLGQTSLVE